MSQEEAESFRGLVEESEQIRTTAGKLLAFVQEGMQQEASSEPRKFRMIVGGGFVEEPIRP
jgi:hypothetical protein